MVKQVAVLLGSVNADNQRMMMEGMREIARNENINLYVFTNYMGVNETEENVYGAAEVMEVPDFKYFDGVIIAPNTIYYPTVAQNVIKKACEAGIPLVSIERDLGVGSVIGADSYGGQLMILEHMYEEHNCRDIAYVAGSPLSPEAKRRREAYKDFLEKHGLPYVEENVYQGDFTYEAGTAAAEYFAGRDKLPQCIACANDAMTQALITQLAKRGYKVPEDVAVVGLDNASFAALNEPQMTTVDKSQTEIGRASVREIIAQMNGEKPQNHQVECVLKVRESCGCNKTEALDVEEMKVKYLESTAGTTRIADVNRNMMADASSAQNPDELMKKIEKYLPWVDMGDFYLCMCERDKVFALPENHFTDEYDITIMNTKYTELAGLPLAYEDGKVKAYPDFELGRVLPEEIRQRKAGKVYVITPVFFQRICFGYCVTPNADILINNPIYYAWLMSIGVMMENTRKWMILKDAAEKLNRMWQYDMMTHVYNRAGFYQEVDKALPRWKEEKKKLFMLFFDVDGLKKVNDSLGHDAGDMLIRAVAESIRRNLDKNILPMRYGGDEFVVMGTFEDENEVTTLIQNIRASIKRMNEEEGYPFQISVSIGQSACEVYDREELSKLIEEADQEMYREKKAKRSQQK